MITVRTGAYSMKPASLHRRILFPLLLCGGLLFALLFWYFSPFFSPGENRRFSAYVEERFHSEVTSSAITLHYTLADPASRGIAPGTASFGTVSIPDRTSYDALLQSVETTLTSFHRNRLSAEIRSRSIFYSTSWTARKCRAAPAFLRNRSVRRSGFRHSFPFCSQSTRSAHSRISPTTSIFCRISRAIFRPHRTRAGKIPAGRVSE